MTVLRTWIQVNVIVYNWWVLRTSSCSSNCTRTRFLTICTTSNKIQRLS